MSAGEIFVEKITCFKAFNFVYDSIEKILCDF